MLLFTALLTLYCVINVVLTLEKKPCPIPKELDTLDSENLIFQLYLKIYDKEYCDEVEYKRRWKIFHENLEYSVKLQKQNPYVNFGLNHLMDWTLDEFKNIKGLQQDIDKLSTRNITLEIEDYVPSGKAIPAEWDWRQQNIITPIKNQGTCLSCYIFSAIGNIEAQYAKKHKTLISLSEQQVLDCASGYDCAHGGYIDAAVQTIIQQGGVEKENDYPYKGKKERCHMNRNKFVVKVNNVKQLGIRDEEQLKDALYNVGPLSIALYTNTQEFLMYRGGGVLDPVSCGNNAADHAVLLVGYGIDSRSRQNYWIIKNSWGNAWGDRGYLKMIRGKKACQILSQNIAVDVQ